MRLIFDFKNINFRLNLNSETYLNEGIYMYAIFVTGGKQFKASEGDVLYIEKIEKAAGETIVFDQVLLISDEGVFKAGAPFVDGAKVEAKLEKNGKGKKIRIFKYKAKKNYRRRIGHRQPYSKIVITAINV